MRKRLAETKARFDAGRWKETLKEAPLLVSAARSIGYQPLIAETLAFTGDVYQLSNDAQAAEKALVEAYRLADASRHDEIRAEVATILVFVVGDQEGHLNDALRWSEAATAVLQRLGGHDLLHAWLLNNLGCALSVHRNDDSAVAALEQGSALKRRLFGPDNTDVAMSEGNLGNVLHGMGRNDEALSHTDRAIAILEKKLGSGHPALARLLYNRGEMLNANHKFQEARATYQRAITIWERELGMDAEILAYPWTGVGVSFLGEHNPSGALAPLERALKIRTGQTVDATDRAETLFALARALWDSGREQTGARRLAEEARTIYSRSTMEKERSDVEGWLLGHGSS